MTIKPRTYSLFGILAASAMAYATSPASAQTDAAKTETLDLVQRVEEVMSASDELALTVERIVEEGTTGAASPFAVTIHFLPDADEPNELLSANRVFISASNASTVLCSQKDGALAGVLNTGRLYFEFCSPSPQSNKKIQVDRYRLLNGSIPVRPRTFERDCEGDDNSWMPTSVTQSLCAPLD